jgi:hypothetical protein
MENKMTPEQEKEMYRHRLEYLESRIGSMTGHEQWEAVQEIKRLSSAPVATDKDVCSACGKVGKTFGEVIDNKDPSITHPICGHCCAMWDDVDTKDDVWAAICVRRNSGEYVVISPPRTEKGDK